MRPVQSVTKTFSRTVRRAIRKPAQFIEDATTFADTHTVINDPFNKLPYPEKQLFGYLNKAQQEMPDSKTAKLARFAKMEKLKSALTFDHIPIERQIVALFPGQGEQHVGMGKALKTHKPSMDLFERASEILGYNLWDLCRSGPKSKLDQTIYCQSAVFVNEMAALEKLKSEVEDFDERLTEVAGFGVGEFCALVAGGILKFDDALKLVKSQAALINECNQLVSCSTFIVQVKASSQLDLAIKEAKEMAIERGEMPLCEISGFLYCGSKIIGASKLCQKFLVENSERFNYKIGKNLPTIGAPYTNLMRPTESKLVEELKSIEFGTAHINVYSNYLGKEYPRKKSDIRRCIFRQFSSPIKWEQIMQVIYRKHQDYKFPLFYEIGSSKQLGPTLFKASKKAYNNYVNFPC